MIELTDKLSSGYWLDVRFIGGKTRRLFYPTADKDYDFFFFHEMSWLLPRGLDLYTEDDRPIKVYKNGVAAVELIEFAAPEASCDDADSTEITT